MIHLAIAEDTLRAGEEARFQAELAEEARRRTAWTTDMCRRHPRRQRAVVEAMFAEALVWAQGLGVDVKISYDRLLRVLIDVREKLG